MALNVKFLKGSSVGYAALDTKNADTFYYTTDDNNLYLGEIKLSNAVDLANAILRVAQNETDILNLTNQLTALTGTGEGSISKMISTAIGELPNQVSILIGNDSNKSVRAIANEELAAQLIPEAAKESLDTLQEIAAWIQKHPEDAAAITKAIDDLEKTVGTIPADATATDVIGYIQEKVNAEKSRAEEVEASLEERITAVEAAVGDSEEVGTQINAALGNLDADIKSAAVTEGEGIQVQVVQVDGKITNVNILGNFDERYEAKGLSSETIQEVVTEVATEKAGEAEANAKNYVDEALTWGSF